jgi:hypothetical protein
VYENDLPTTSQKYNSVNGNMVTSTDGGFTFVVNTQTDDSKLYNNDGWSVKTGLTLGNIGVIPSDFETTTVSGVTTTIKQQKYVILNKTYSDLSKYCYYGSSNAMLNGAVNDIISNFPAALNITTREDIITNGAYLTIPLSDVENNFEIDLFNYYPEERVNLTYDLRVLATSYADYEIVNEDELYAGTIINFTGYTTGNTTSITFEVSGFTSVTGNTYLIRPNEAKRDSFFDTLDDFESVLLNRYSVPKYRSYFNLPVEGTNGISFEYKSFTWPTSDGYDIDIESSSYTSFLSELVDATNFIDEIYCDNIYRMLTHDTIKNLDQTYEREIDEIKLDEIVVGGTKIQKVLRLYGRSYDEIKKYIEGISFVNTITYDNKDNLPIDYFDGKLNTNGWDTFTLMSTIDKSAITSSSLYEGNSRYYSTDDVNTELLRRMIINSKYIFRSKGTKKSIRKMFGLLGFEEDWYEIREYTQLIDNLISGNTLETIAALNYEVYPESYSTSDGKDDFSYSFDETLFDNTNIGIYARCPYCGGLDYIVSGETYITSGDTYGEDNTAICLNDGKTFDLTGNTIGYPKPLDNSTAYYFQQKGNWYRETGGIHTDLSGMTNYVNEISYGNNPHIGYENSDSTGYDNGYDYIDEFNDIFKRFVRGSGEIGTVDITDYTTGNTSYNRFNISTKKKEDDTKIKFSNNEYDNSLILNLKNIIIGINGSNVLNSFTSGNTEITNIIFETGITGQTISNPESTFVKITNKTLDSSKTLIINIGDNEKLKLITDSSNTGHTFVDCSNIVEELIPGNNYIINKTGSTVTINDYNGEDEFILLKAIALPYIEQLVPATAIFDFVQIDNKNPKWKLVDEYLYRDPSTGYYDGDTILAYQNINYFDTNTSGYTSGLTNSIITDYGTGFTYYGSIIKTDSETGSKNGFDNIYMFKGKLLDTSINYDAQWVIDSNLIT